MSLCAISSKCHALARMFHARICCLLFVKCFALALDAVWPLSRTTFTLTLSFYSYVFLISLARRVSSRSDVVFSYRENVHYSTRMLVKLALLLSNAVVCCFVDPSAWHTCNWRVVVLVVGPFHCLVSTTWLVFGVPTNDSRFQARVVVLLSMWTGLVLSPLLSMHKSVVETQKTLISSCARL